MRPNENTYKKQMESFFTFVFSIIFLWMFECDVEKMQSLRIQWLSLIHI